MFTHIGISEAAHVADLRYLCTSLRPSYSQQVWPSHPCEQNQQTSGLHSFNQLSTLGEHRDHVVNTPGWPPITWLAPTDEDRRGA